MIVRVVKASGPRFWYADQIGKEFDVEPTADGENYKIKGDHLRVLAIKDCQVIEPRAGLTLIAPGSRGKIDEIDILITEVHIESRQVEYTVSWWTEGVRYNERVPDYEITEAERTMKVGFQ